MIHHPRSFSLRRLLSLKSRESRVPAHLVLNVPGVTNEALEILVGDAIYFAGRTHEVA